MRLKQALIRTPGFDRPASTVKEQGSLVTARLARFPVTDNSHALPSPVFRLAEIGREPRAVIISRLSPRTLSRRPRSERSFTSFSEAPTIARASSSASPAEKARTRTVTVPFAGS